MLNKVIESIDAVVYVHVLFSLVFQHCPFLRDNIANLDAIVSRWRDYKYSVPTYGAVLIDPTYEHVLLVRGFYSRESWGFPKGKVQENESPLKCAIREVENLRNRFSLKFVLFSGYGRSRIRYERSSF